MSYINIQGKGLKFNQGAIMWMQEKFDAGNLSATAGYATVWGGLKANAYVKGEELTMTFEEVCDWVETLSNDELTAINNCFEQSQAYKKLIETAAADTEEKKSVSPELNTADGAISSPAES